jgi:hypothetical protein
MCIYGDCLMQSAMSMGTTPLEHLKNTKHGALNKTKRNLSTSLAGSWIPESPDLPHDISGDSSANTSSSLEVRNFVAWVSFKMVV